ncbi:hypothetical protein ACLBXO_27995 [Methylobacterium sp. C33D]
MAPTATLLAHARTGWAHDPTCPRQTAAEAQTVAIVDHGDQVEKVGRPSAI